MAASWLFVAIMGSFLLSSSGQRRDRDRNNNSRENSRRFDRERIPRELRYDLRELESSLPPELREERWMDESSDDVFRIVKVRNMSRSGQSANYSAVLLRTRRGEVKKFYDVQRCTLRKGLRSCKNFSSECIRHNEIEACSQNTSYQTRRREDDQLHMKESRDYSNLDATDYATIPNSIKDEVEEFERKIPNELERVEWEKVSKRPLRLVKVRNITENEYEGNFSAIFTKLKEDRYRTFYEALKCKGRGFRMRCTNLTESCTKDGKFMSCDSSASSVRRRESTDVYPDEHRRNDERDDSMDRSGRGRSYDRRDRDRSYDRRDRDRSYDRRDRDRSFERRDGDRSYGRRDRERSYRRRDNERSYRRQGRRSYERSDDESSDRRRDGDRSYKRREYGRSSRRQNEGRSYRRNRNGGRSYEREGNNDRSYNRESDRYVAETKQDKQKANETLLFRSEPYKRLYDEDERRRSYNEDNSARSYNGRSSDRSYDRDEDEHRMESDELKSSGKEHEKGESFFSSEEFSPASAIYRHRSYGRDDDDERSFDRRERRRSYDRDGNVRSYGRRSRGRSNSRRYRSSRRSRHFDRSFNRNDLYEGSKDGQQSDQTLFAAAYERLYGRRDERRSYGRDEDDDDDRSYDRMDRDRSYDRRGRSYGKNRDYGHGESDDEHFSNGNDSLDAEEYMHRSYGGDGMRSYDRRNRYRSFERRGRSYSRLNRSSRRNRRADRSYRRYDDRYGQSGQEGRADQTLFSNAFDRLYHRRNMRRYRGRENRDRSYGRRGGNRSYQRRPRQYERNDDNDRSYRRDYNRYERSKTALKDGENSLFKDVNSLVDDEYRHRSYDRDDSRSYGRRSRSRSYSRRNRPSRRHRSYVRSYRRDSDRYEDSTQDENGDLTLFSEAYDRLYGRRDRRRSYGRDSRGRSSSRWNRGRSYSRRSRSYGRNRNYDRSYRRDYDQYKNTEVTDNDRETSFINGENTNENQEEYRRRSYVRDNDVRSYNRRMRGRSYSRRSRSSSRSRNFDRSHGRDYDHFGESEESGEVDKTLFSDSNTQMYGKRYENRRSRGRRSYDRRSNQRSYGRNRYNRRNSRRRSYDRDYSDYMDTNRNDMERLYDQGNDERSYDRRNRGRSYSRRHQSYRRCRNSGRSYDRLRDRYDESKKSDSKETLFAAAYDRLYGQRDRRRCYGSDGDDRTYDREDDDRDYERPNGRKYEQYKEEGEDGVTLFSDENNFLNDEEYRQRSYDRNDDVRSYSRRNRDRSNRSSRRYKRFDRSYSRHNDRSYDREDRNRRSRSYERDRDYERSSGRDYDHYIDSQKEGENGETFFSAIVDSLDDEVYRSRSYDRDENERSTDIRNRGRRSYSRRYQSNRRCRNFDRSYDRIRDRFEESSKSTDANKILFAAAYDRLYGKRDRRRCYESDGDDRTYDREDDDRTYRGRSLSGRNRDDERSSSREYEYESSKKEGKSEETLFADSHDSLDGEEYRRRSSDRGEDERSYNRRNRGRMNRSSRRNRRFDRSYNRDFERSYDRDGSDRSFRRRSRLFGRDWDHNRSSRRDNDQYIDSEKEKNDEKMYFSNSGDSNDGEEYRRRSYDRDEVRSYGRRNRGRDYSRRYQSSRRSRSYDRSFDNNNDRDFERRDRDRSYDNDRSYNNKDFEQYKDSEAKSEKKQNIVASVQLSAKSNKNNNIKGVLGVENKKVDAHGKIGMEVNKKKNSVNHHSNANIRTRVAMADNGNAMNLKGVKSAKHPSHKNKVAADIQSKVRNQQNTISKREIDMKQHIPDQKVVNGRTKSKDVVKLSKTTLGDVKKGQLNDASDLHMRHVEKSHGRSQEHRRERFYKGSDRHDDEEKLRRDYRQNRDDNKSYRRGRSQENEDREYQEQYKSKTVKNDQEKDAKDPSNKIRNTMSKNSKVSIEELSKSNNKDTNFARSYDRDDSQRDYKGRRYDRSYERKRFNRDREYEHSDRRDDRTRSYDSKRDYERSYERERSNDRNGKYDRSYEKRRSYNRDSFEERESKMLPETLSRKLGRWETELPRELINAMWTIDSERPLRMTKVRNISQPYYRGNFSATVIQYSDRHIKTYYESIRCTQRGDVETCSNSSVGCDWDGRIKECLSNTSIITKTSRHADIAREQSLNLIHIEPLSDGILKRIFTNGLEYLESANLPTYLLKDLKEWESDLPTELKTTRWETSSRGTPVRLSKTKLVHKDHYNGNFSASITKDEGELMKTRYDERSCLHRRDMESCTTMDSSCLWYNKHKTCNTHSKKRVRVPYYYQKRQERYGEEDGDSDEMSLDNLFSAVTNFLAKEYNEPSK